MKTYIKIAEDYVAKKGEGREERTRYNWKN